MSRIEVLEWFDTLPDYVLEKTQGMPPEEALEQVEITIEELNVIAESLRADTTDRRNNCE